MTINFDITAFQQTLERTASKATEGAKRGVHDAMDDLLRVSRDLAPLDKGTLRTNAWNEVEADGGTITGEVYYSAVEDGPNGRVNYALITHEMGEYKSPTTPGTQPKYLEQPLKMHADEYMRWIAEEIRKELT